jgi:transposase
VFRTEFAEGRRIDETVVLSELLAELNVDLNPAFAAAQTDAIKAKLRSQTEEGQDDGALNRQYATVAAEIRVIEKHIHAWHRACEESRRLEEIPGIGPIVATALIADRQGY